LKRSQI